MDIQVDDHCMILGGHSLSYSAYYFDVDKYAALPSGEILKEIFVQWANALTNIGNGQSIFLPFSLDDEWVECLQVTQHGEKLTYQYVRVSENGWALDVTDLSEFMASAHHVRKVMPEIAGECEKSEFISALLNAKVSAA